MKKQLRTIKLLLESDIPPGILIQLAYQQFSQIGMANILSALLGTTIVGASAVIKIPQIKKILDPKTFEGRVRVVDGLALEGINLETLCQLIHTSYSYNNKFAFNTYGETLLLAAQNLIIKHLIQYYRFKSALLKSHLDKISLVRQLSNRMIKIVLAHAVIVALILKAIPVQALSFLEATCIPLSIISRIPQIKMNYELKSTRHLAPITVGANVLGSLIRIFTSLQNKQGKVILLGYCSSFILNVTMAGQVFYYNRLTNDNSEDKVEKS